jgi:hypothetical protein
VSDMYHFNLPAHALRPVHVRLKSVSKEGNFTLEVKTVSRQCLTSHCSGVLEICQVALPAHALQGVQVRLKSVNNERYFILVTVTASSCYFPHTAGG